jgi:Ni,Fe-hydrogenase III large subunit
MAALADIIAQARRVDGHRPVPRAVVTPGAWRAVAGELAAGHATLLGLWGDTGAVHMAVMGEAGRDINVVSIECPGGNFPSVGALHPPAIRLERTIQSLYGLEPIGAADTRPWLDLGFWDVQHPLSAHPQQPGEQSAYAFLPVQGEGLHRIPVGPVHAGIIEPGHFRFTANGETVVRLEQRLGYVHKGIESLMAGATIEKAAQLAGRTSGDSTVAYALAFAHAVEAALNIAVPPRAQYLRALMAELERLANHFGDIGAICNDASFTLMHAHCGILRERILRAADACFGHRLMMDRIVPGGVARDIATDGGYVGRASGRAFDARKAHAYAPYDRLEFEVPILTAGDVNARVWVRIREVEQSLALVDQILARLPDGAIVVPVTAPAGMSEGLGLAEGFRGDVLAWLRLDGLRVVRCHLRDPSWFQWPLLEAAIENNIVADFPLCNKSFNCSYSGHDL